jgi:hypothetical protein
MAQYGIGGELREHLSRRQRSPEKGIHPSRRDLAVEASLTIYRYILSPSFHRTATDRPDPTRRISPSGQ